MSMKEVAQQTHDSLDDQKTHVYHPSRNMVLP